MEWGRYAVALGLTVVVEVPVLAALLVRGAGIPRRRATGTAALANLLSHPLLVFGLLPLARRELGQDAGLLTAEALVVALEAAVFRRAGASHGLAWASSAFANGASLLLGLGLAR